MIEYTLTTGQLLDALKVEVFDKNTQNDFQRKRLDREKFLKQYIGICGIILHQLVEKPGLSYKELSHWKKAKVKVCMENLIIYTEELVNELERDKIENYCKTVTSSFLPFGRNAFEPGSFGGFTNMLSPYRMAINLKP